MRKLALLVLVAACHRAAPPTTVATPEQPVRAPDKGRIMSADQLVGAMRERYAGKWYRTLTFVQKSTFLRPDGTTSRVETWYEAIALPGRLRIDLGDPSRGNGVVYRGDSVYTLQQGHITDRRIGRNPLLILGFDVYAQPAQRTMAQLRAENINLDVMRMDTLYGRPVYVVGAGPGDTTSNQFWVDADRMLFVRLIQTDPQRRATRDIRFENYVQRGGGWVAELVRILAGDKVVFQEEYSDVRVNAPLSDDVFVPEKWAAASPWNKP
ncbi:MAG TPA: hypothetical protein VFT29_18910 [Gemmatimonadaceae bacterium]|nr:hypothetical protein [Gemmatimonadaceae bacterium]